MSFNLAENVNYVSTSVDTGDFRIWEVQRNSLWSTLMWAHAGSDMLSISLSWVRKDYLRLREEHLNIAEPWIGGSFTYDAVSNLVIKVYSSRLGKVPDQEALLVR